VRGEARFETLLANNVIHSCGQPRIWKDFGPVTFLTITVNNHFTLNNRPLEEGGYSAPTVVSLKIQRGDCSWLGPGDEASESGHSAGLRRFENLDI